MNLEPYLILDTKINSKYITDQIRAKTTKLSKERVGVKIYDLGLGDDFLNMIIKA